MTKPRLDKIESSPRFREPKCAEIEDKDFFFPDSKLIEAERLPELKQICASCIHREECLEFALKERIVYGFWGGATADQRRSFIRRGKRDVPTSKAILIRQMLGQNKSATEISITLDCSSAYVYKVVAQLESEAREGASQSDQTQRKSSTESPSFWWFQR